MASAIDNVAYVLTLAYIHMHAMHASLAHTHTHTHTSGTVTGVVAHWSRTEDGAAHRLCVEKAMCGGCMRVQRTSAGLRVSGA